MSKAFKIVTEDEKASIIGYCTSGKIPDALTGYTRANFIAKASHFIVREGHLYLKKGLDELRFFADFEISEKLRYIKLIHGDSHIGIRKVEHRIFGETAGISRKDIRDYISKCHVCQASTPITTLQPIQPIVEYNKLDRYIADSIDMRAYASLNDGFKWVLNVVDSFTKFAWSFRLKEKSAIVYATAFKGLFYTEGVPKILHTDNGKEFKNALLDELCTELNIKRVFGRVRHPQSQGQVERFNQTLKRRLGKAVEGSGRWIDAHDKVVYEYNITLHRATNQTPFMLHKNVQGFRNEVAKVDGDEMSNELDSYRQNYLSNMARTSNFNPKDIAIGSTVLLKKDFDNNVLTKKQALDFPYEEKRYDVIEMEGRAVTILHKDEIVTVDLSRLKKVE
ncbi:hypothetical protein ENBRE01_2744 [Enteropsectra breve]|nr:hypothetical protein ENBRE01_2744 [Enteropsectra breve]